MDEETFKFEMDQLRKYERNAEWFPLAVIAITWAGLWWNAIDLDRQTNAILAAIGTAGYLIYREVCGARAMIVRTYLLAERAKGKALESRFTE